MPSTPVRHDDHGYLQESRHTVLRCVDGLGEDELRHPMTPTGTNLLGVHAGQLQILRELIDGQAGPDRSDAGDEAWWSAYTYRLEQLARRFRS